MVFFKQKDIILHSLPFIYLGWADRTGNRTCYRYWSKYIDTGKALFVWNSQKSLLEGALKYRHIHKAAAFHSGMVEKILGHLCPLWCLRNHCIGHSSWMLSPVLLWPSMPCDQLFTTFTCCAWALSPLCSISLALSYCELTKHGTPLQKKKIELNGLLFAFWPSNTKALLCSLIL